ncbi:MAG: competence/damage-inducible protein A [Polyangiaceae bacterium]|nr:competence/damage-inducible protein A [Polyangiaceae bacterium]
MKVAILCIGSELTRGELVDTNGPWLARALGDQGHDVDQIVCVPDQPAPIALALQHLAGRYQAIVATGGLGPTTDDLTRDVVARVVGVPLERNTEQLEAIRQRLAARGRGLTESNARQADVPRGARVLPNAHGTAPGFSVSIGASRAIFMPGVPREMRAMFAAHAGPALGPAPDAATAQVVLRTSGMPESAVCDALGGLEKAYGVSIAYQVHVPDLDVKVLARADTRAEATARARAAADEARQRLGPHVVFGEGQDELAGVVGSLLVERGRSLALAESCTGGLVAELLTDHPGASRFFAGGVVSYANEAKRQLLGVPREALEQWGAVSEQVARAMAEGARRSFGVDLALALTGIAGPEGGSDEKPVGLVYIALAGPQSVDCERHVLAGGRSDVRLRAAYAGLALVRRTVLERSVGTTSDANHGS